MFQHTCSLCKFYIGLCSLCMRTGGPMTMPPAPGTAPAIPPIAARPGGNPPATTGAPPAPSRPAPMRNVVY